MNTKRKFLALAGAIGLSVLGSSCHYPHYGHSGAGTGAVAGGLIGAGVGTIVGSNNHRPWEGAAIGGAVGAIGGALIGSSYNRGYHGNYRSSYRHGYRGHGGYGGGHCAPPPPRCGHYGGGYHRY